MDSLADRIEALSGPCRETDGLIMRMTHSDREFHEFEDCLGMRCLDDSAAWIMPKHYTASLDAAMSLVPEGYAAAVGTMFGAPQKPWACVWTPQGEPKYRTEASTPALALCAAAMRARGE